MVYVVTDGSGCVKIGVASQLKDRLCAMQTGNPRPITVLFTFETSSIKEDRRLEKTLHNEFRQHRISFDNGFISEWFDSQVLVRLNTNDDFVKYICDKYGFLKITAHNGTSYSDVESRRTDKLKTVMSSLNVYDDQKQENENVEQANEKAEGETKAPPMFNPGDVVTTKRTLNVGKMYGGFSFANGMGVWRAVVCDVHEWEHGFYYTLDNQKSYSEEMLEVYEPWKKKPIKAQAV